MWSYCQKNKKERFFWDTLYIKIPMMIAEEQQVDEWPKPFVGPRSPPLKILIDDTNL